MIPDLLGVPEDQKKITAITIPPQSTTTTTSTTTATTTTTTTTTAITATGKRS
jgi:hypothetical protein